jgi:ubiquitin-protein ligase
MPLLRHSSMPSHPVTRLLEECFRPRASVLFEGRTNQPLPSSLVHFDIPSYNDISQPQAEREQALRDYKVTIEFKHLKSHAPGGVYLIPSLGELRTFYGVIFVRRGPFTNGIFKFRLQLPLLYNELNQHPQIFFTTAVYNPHVDPATGELDIKNTYPRWDPARHYLVTVLTFLKKIFYAKSFGDASANVQARDLANQDPAAFRTKVDACVRDSQKDVFQNLEESTLKFTEDELSHRVLRDLLRANIRDVNQISKQALLAMIDKASKV